MGTSNVVPTNRNFSSGESTAIVGTRLGFSGVLHVYLSARGVSLPSLETDIMRTWSGPNECTTYSMSFERRYANDLAVPLFPSATLPVGLTPSSFRRPSAPTAKLEAE